MPTAPAGGDDDGPPLDELDAQMHNEPAAQAARESPRAARRAPSARSEHDEDEDARSSSEPLPELNDLVAKLPTEVRETLEELFRARFVTVKKISRRVLAPAAHSKS